jgi:AAA family ATPase
MVFRTAGDRKVRPSFRDDLKDVFKIYLSPAIFLHMNPGDICTLETSKGVAGPAVAWSATEKIKDDVVQLSRALQKLYSIKLDSRVTISYSNVSVMDAFEIALREVSFDESAISTPSLDKDESLDWAVLLKSYLHEADLLTPGLEIENVMGFGVKKTFRIIIINASIDRGLYRAAPKCKVRIVEQTSLDQKHHHDLSVAFQGIGGLYAQVTQINAKLKAFQKPHNHSFHPLYQPCEGGIILYGPSGTGKSLLLGKIAAAGWRQVVSIDRVILAQGYDGARAALDRTFSLALENQPSVIIIEDLESIATFRNVQDSVGPHFGPSLMQQLKRLVNSRTLVVGAARTLLEIHSDLRKAEYFEDVIEFPVPDTKSRSEILKILGGLPRDGSHSTLDDIAARTPGFVGSDLKRLLKQAIRSFHARIELHEGSPTMDEPEKPEVMFTDMQDDLNNALTYVRPVALQDDRLKIPEVRWTDIAGQAEVKKILEEALDWPIRVIDILS